MFFCSDIQVRFSDTDAFGHLNNASFAVYSEFGRVDFFNKVAKQQGNLILAHLATDFIKQVSWTQALKVHTYVTKIGNTSISLYQEILADETLAAKAKSVVVLFNYQTQSKTPVTQALKETLEPYFFKSSGLV